MHLLTHTQCKRLIANGFTPGDHAPVVKLFNPCGAATWLFSELDADGDTLFGLCDLGFGSPELGYASLAEIAALRLPLGLSIERDLCFEGCLPISAYAAAARLAGSITENPDQVAQAAARLDRERGRSPSSHPPDDG